MSRKAFHRTPKEIIIKVKENPLDISAKKYIDMFSRVVADERAKKAQQK